MKGKEKEPRATMIAERDAYEPHPEDDDPIRDVMAREVCMTENGQTTAEVHSNYPPGKSESPAVRDAGSCIVDTACKISVAGSA